MSWGIDTKRYDPRDCQAVHVEARRRAGDGIQEEAVATSSCIIVTTRACGVCIIATLEVKLFEPNQIGVGEL